jgi:hypothetical protein
LECFGIGAQRCVGEQAGIKQLLLAGRKVAVEAVFEVVQVIR